MKVQGGSMNFRRATLIVCLFGLLISNQLMAQKRITDMNGREVRVGSRVAPQTTQTVKAASLHPRASAIVNVSAGPDTDAANNDYRRIQNALNAAANGDTIILSGTFDFTQPFAAAAWAAGNDGVAGNGDDYEVSAPRGINNVTVTANSLGSATIQGPGDLPALDLEAFLVFDASLAPGGGSPGWTISNLRVLDFDLGIAFFAVSNGDYSNTTVANNFIRIPTDLNATVAPSDVLQNIGLHFSFGTNQAILGNAFQVAGDGVSDTGAGNFSTSVVMQSNTSGGSSYDGLNISNNVTHILNAQSANPQVTLGIWDNCHAHTSNITISGNSFLNDAVGNSPSLNLERAFRVTSHSGASTTVAYNNNTASGANIGFQWLAGSNFAGNQAVVLTGNTLTSCDTGVLVQSNGIAHLDTNTITGSGAGAGLHLVTGTLTASGANTNSVFRNFITGGSADGILIDATASAITDPMTQNDFSGNTGFGLNNLSATGISAAPNWWGNNLAANVAAKVNGMVTFDPWLASGSDVSPLAGFQPFTWATTTTAGNLTTLLGTGAADTGAALAGSPNTTFQMDGDTGLVVTAQLVSLSIQLGGSDDVFTLGALGVPTTFDGGAGNDTLIGTNIAQTWNITGANSGNIPGVATSFSNTESLRGGTAADSFVFGAAGSVALTIDGNLGVDTLDNSAIPGHFVTPSGPGTLDGFMGTASGVGTTFDNINVVASPADMSVVKTGPASANASTVISYTITATNGGPNPAINASLSDTIPAGTTFASVVAPGGWSCATPPANGTGTVTCTNSSMAVGSAIFTLNVNGPAGTATVSNTASVSSASTDNTPGNNSSTAVTNVTTTADLSITKTPAPGPYGTSSPLTYTIAVNNAGPGAASGVVVTDIIPVGTTLVSAVPSQGSCSGTTTVTCNLGTINNLGSATISLTITLPSTAGPVSNTATATTASTDPNPGNNSSTSAITVVASSNIPATSPRTLLLLAIALAMAGFIALRMK
jgi:uncharacterized repeat protein (TIGR01451 family)